MIEKIQKFDAEVIILYLGKKNIELLLQQVIIRSLFLLSLLCFIDVNFMESKFESVSHFMSEALSTRKDIYMDHSRTGLILELAINISILPSDHYY